MFEKEAPTASPMNDCSSSLCHGSVPFEQYYKMTPCICTLSLSPKYWRRYAVLALDPQTTVVEDGIFLDTIGWVSFANKDSVQRWRWNQQRLQDDNTTEGQS